MYYLIINTIQGNKDKLLMVIYQIFETIDIKGYKALRGNDLLSVSPWAFRTMHSCEISLAAT